MTWLEVRMGVARHCVCAGALLTLGCGGTARPISDDGTDTDGTGDSNVPNTGDGSTLNTGDGGDTQTWTDPGSDPVDPLTWSKSYDGGLYDAGLAVTVDSQDNVLVVGLTEDVPDLLLWLGKYDPWGQEIWIQTAALSGRQYAGIATDSQDNLVVTALLGAPGLHDAWVAKWNPGGENLWLRVFEEGDHSEGRGVAVDSHDNIIVTGVVTTIEGTGDDNEHPDVWLAKYDASGTELWSQAIDMTGADAGSAVAVDAADNIVVAGEIWGGEPTEAIWIAKYDPDGVEIWTEGWNDGANNRATGVAIDHEQNIAVVGRSLFGGGGGEHVFLGKYSAGGGALWTQVVMPGRYDVGRAVAVDFAGNIAGTGSSMFAGEEGDRAWVGKYDADGNQRWTELLTHGYEDKGNGIATDSLGYVIVTGIVRDADYNDDIFVRKLAP